MLWRSMHHARVRSDIICPRAEIITNCAILRYSCVIDTPLDLYLHDVKLTKVEMCGTTLTSNIYMWPHKELVMYTVHISHSMNMLYTLCKSTASLSAKDNVQCCITSML